MGKSILSYKRASILVNINFPNQEKACKWCHLFCKYEENFKRYSCKLTGEWILNPLNAVGEFCPLEWEEKNEVQSIKGA